MTEQVKDNDQREGGLAIEAETSLEQDRRTASGRVRPVSGNDDTTPLIMGALEKLASATDQMAHQLSERLETVRRDFGQDLREARDEFNAAQNSGLENFREATQKAEEAMRSAMSEATESQSTRDNGMRQAIAEGFDSIVEQTEKMIGTQTGRVRDSLEGRIEGLAASMEEKLDAMDQAAAKRAEDDGGLAESFERLAEQIREQQEQLQAQMAEQFERLATQMREQDEKQRSLLERIQEDQKSSEEEWSKSFAELGQKIEDLEKATDARDGESRQKLLDGQREVINTLAEGMGLAQEAWEKRLGNMEENLDAWQAKNRESFESFQKKQEERLDAVEEQARSVSELGSKLDENHASMMKLFETEQSRADEAEHARQVEEARRTNNAGVARYHSGDFAGARDLFEKAVELDTSFAEAFNNLGLCLTELGENDDATVAFETAVELNPNLGASYNNLGYVLYLQENYVAAIEMYKEAIGHRHDTSAAYTNLGNAYQKLGETEKAVDSWQRALEVDPSNERAQQYLDRFAGGMTGPAEEND